MVNGKPITLWAVLSVALSVLGCVASLAFPLFAEEYGRMANRSAGVGGIWMVLHLLAAAALCLLGILCGVVALVRVSGGARGGRGLAWAGIILGALPLAATFVSYLFSAADSNPPGW